MAGSSACCLLSFQIASGRRFWSVNRLPPSLKPGRDHLDYRLRHASESRNPEPSFQKGDNHQEALEMTHGMILYLRDGQDDELAMPSSEEFIDSVQSLDITTVCLATSQDQILQCWWRLIREGMHQISYVTAAYDPSKDRLHSFSTPARLMGCA